MKPTARLRSYLAIAGSTLLAISYSHAADGTWTQTLAGPFDWDDIANWNSGAGPIADGADFTAFFTANITAGQTVNLNNAKTIGNITFTDSTTSSNDLTISGANILTLDRTDATKPTINVTQSGRLLTISSVIAGNDGLLKSGAGTLVFTSTSNNTFTGGFDISGGVVQYDSATNANAWGDAANVITFTGDATLYNSNNAYTLARAITINNGVTATLTGAFGESTNVTGAVTGTGTLNVSGFSNGWAVTLSNTGNTFTGAVGVFGGSGSASLSVASLGNSANAITLGTGSNGAGTFTYTGSAALSRALTLGGTTSGGTFNSSGAGVITIGSSLSITSNGAKTLTLGGTNTGANTFSGSIGDSGSGATAITKADGGRWVLSNTANSYTGGTTVTAGTLETGASNVLGAGNVTVTGGTLQLGALDHTMGVVTITGGTIDGSGTLTANRLLVSGGTISSLLAGSADLYKSGTGTTSLTKANSFSGGITVAGGTLAVGASATLGTNTVGNSITIANDGILTLAAAANSGSNQAIILSSSLNTGVPVIPVGAGPVGRLAVLGLGFNGLPNGTISQANTLGGVIAINAVAGYNTDLSSVFTGKNLFLGAIGTSTFTGAAGTVVAGNDSLYRLGGGGGTLTFSTTNLFTGGSGVQVGSTLANGGGTVVVNAAQNYSGATTVNAGTLTLSGASGTATGSSGFTLNGGRLFLDSSGVVGNNNANRIGAVNASLRNGGELSLNGNAAGTTEAFGNLSIGSGYSIVTAAATTTASTLSGIGFSRTNNGTALFRGTALGTNVAAMGQVTLSNTTGLSFVGNTTLINAASGDTTKDVKIVPYLIGGTTGTDTGTTFVTYDDTLGFRALSTTNQFNTTVTSGENIRLTAAQTGITTPSINSLIIANTGSSTIADGATLTVASGAVLFSAAGTIAPVGSGTGILDFGAAEGIVTTVANGTISARITGSGGLTKSGTGSLTLSNTNNSYTGGTVLNGGSLSTSVDGNLGGSGGVTVNGNAGWYMGATAVSYARTLTINDGATLTLTSGNAGKTVTGVLSGNGTLFANHSTDFIFSNAANTFTGAIISATANSTGYGLGFASIGDTAGAGSINLVGGTGTFRWTSASGSTTTLANRQFSISTPGQATISAFGTTAASNLVINKDLLITGEAGARSLRLAGTNTGNNTFAGKITDSPGSVMSVSKVEAGTWLSTNTSNTYTGGTTVSAGTLGFANGSLGTSGTINASGGTLLWDTGNTQDISSRLAMTAGTTSNFDTNGNNVIFATGIGGGTTGALTKKGLGTLTLGGTNTYTGATTVDAGTLLVNGSLASGSAVTVNGADLGGTGTIGGNVTVNNTAGGVTPGASTGTAGTLPITGNLTLTTLVAASAGKLKFELGANGIGTSDRITVGGNLVLTNNNLNLADFQFISLAGLANGTYPLITYTGTLTGGLAASGLIGTGNITGLGGTGDGTLQIDTINKVVQLVVTNASGGGGDVTPPTLTGITDNVGGGPITEDASVTYTVTFNEDINSATVTAADFDNQGTSAVNIGTITETSPGVFTVVVTPTNPGTLILRIPSGAVVSDTSGNNLVVPVSDNTTITVRSKYEAWSGALDFDSDTNGDGVKNGLAFLLGAANKNVSALGLLPTVTQSGGNLILNFQMLNQANRKSASIQVQQSRDLGISDAWVDSAVVPEANGVSPSVNGVTFNVTLGTPTNAVIATVAASEALPGTKLFGRLKANQ